jgi:hypothetical protein
MTLTFGDSRIIEHIVNGGFEDDTTGWITGATGFIGTSSTEQFHAGLRSGLMIFDDGNLQSFRQNFSAVDHDVVTSFGFWRKSSSYYTYIKLYFSDLTDYEYWIWNGESLNTWNYIDIMSVIVNPCFGDLLFPVEKSVTGIEFLVDYSYSGPTFIDEVSLLVGGLIEAISWEEEQSCDVAMRDIPLNDDGVHIDTGTYVLNPRILSITMRMTDTQKTEFLSYFSLNTLMTFYSDDGIGIWTYVGWFKEYPKIYEYNKKNSIEIRKWKCNLKFIIQSISYSGSTYNESIETIVIDGENYNPVIDFATGITNTLSNDEQYVNNSTVSLETDVWNKSETKLSYVIRTSSAGKYLLDQLIAAHAVTTLIDREYGYSNYIWIQNINEIWEGEVNCAKPWKIELTLILLIDLGAY